jgi:N-acetylneuraminic acid mutarotase
MPAMDARAAACLLVAVATGCGDDTASGTPDGSTEERCETTTPWARAPRLALGPTQETAVVAVEGKIYVLGGFLETAITNAVQVFDVAACAWSRGPNLPKAVHHVNAAAWGGTIYVVGAMEGASFTSIGDTWSWNPATDARWRARAPMPAGTQRGASVAGAIDGKIYVAGGLRNGTVADVSIYDPDGDAWTAGPALPQPRDHGCGGVVGGKLYVAGGRSGGGNSPLLFELDPTNLGAGWVERAPMPTARSGTGCGVIGDRIVVIGGEGNPAPGSRGVFPEAEAYDAVANTWQPLAPMPTPRHGMGAAAWDGRIYVPGGADQQAFGAVATHEILTP